MQPVTTKHRRCMIEFSTIYLLNLRSIWRVFWTRHHKSIWERKKWEGGQERTIPRVGEAIAEAGGPRDPRSLDLGLKRSLGGFVSEGRLRGAHRKSSSCSGCVKGWRRWLRRRSGHEPPVIICRVHGGLKEVGSCDASSDRKGRSRKKGRRE